MKPPTASNNSRFRFIIVLIDSALNHINPKLKAKFNGSCLRQAKATFSHKEVVNIYIVYQIDFGVYTRGAGITLEIPLF